MAATGTGNWLQNLYGELKERRVMRVATLYVILFWPIIQVADILSPAMGLPEEAMRYLLLMFVVGLPVALVLSWLFDLNRSGIVRARAAPEAESRPLPLLGRRVERAVIALLLAVIAVLFYFQNATDGTQGEAEAGAAPGVRSLAVLPFATFSENREDEFFSDGLTEELLNVLSKLSSLRVIARTTSFAYKGVNRNVQDIGYELGVDTILEGSVRRNDIDDTIRVTAQLIDVESGAHIWSQTFDRQYRDVFKIQDEIAGAVLEQLQVTLLAGEQSAPRLDGSISPETLVVVSMGRAELAKRTAAGFEDALRFFDRAVAMSPAFAEAHAERAKTFALMHSYGDRTDNVLEFAEQAVESALELDGNSADAWAAAGLIGLQRKDKGAADSALRKALALNPSHPMAHMWLAQLQEDPAERFAMHQRAFELDPRSPVAGWNVANDLFMSGRDAEAMDVFDGIIEADPYYPQAYELAARIDESHGRLAAAIPNYARAMELGPRAHIAMRLAYLYIDIGDAAQARLWADKAEQNGADANDLAWLRVSALVADGDRAGADVIMRAMLDVGDGGTAADSNAAIAGYFLGEPQRVVDAWQRLEAAGRGLPVPKRHDNAGPEAAIAAAHAYTQLGAHAQAEPILDGLEAWLDDELSARGPVNPDLWYNKAQVMSIRGEQSLALQNMQRAIDAGWRQHWRPADEPCLEQLQTIETFQSMMAGLAARMDLMGEQLEFEGYFAAAAANRRG